MTKLTWQSDGSLDETTGKAEFVPGSHHPTLIIKIVCLFPFQCDTQRSTFRRDSCRIIPLQVVRLDLG
jgi:hypothetical protein